MNKRLESLLDRIPTWPPEGQDWAAMALDEIEERVRILQSLTPEERAKHAALRGTINRSIVQGGSDTDEEVEASISATLDAWERERKGAWVARLRFSKSANADLKFHCKIHRRPQRQQNDRGTFAQELRAKCAQLAAAPILMGRPQTDLRHDLRSHPHKSYVIFFRYVGDTLEIVNVIEGHRDIPALFKTDDAD